MSTIFTNSFGQAHGNRKPALSVIIPTYRRKCALLRGLNALVGQVDVDPRDFEVVVSDDGSGDDTGELVRTWSESVSLRLKLFAGDENRGPAHARNRAIAVAEGHVLLIIGDDILPPEDFVARHLRWHQAHPDERAALLGRICWPEAPRPTPFMNWLATAGRAFYFSYPDCAGPVAPERFYTCNVSIKHALVLRCGAFREDFPYASHEDIELGVRLADQGGMHLHFDPKVVAIHAHQLTLPGTVRRVYLNGCSSVLYWQWARDHAGPARRSARRLCRCIARLVPYTLIRRMGASMPRPGWYGLLVLAYWRGVVDATRNQLSHGL